MRYSYVGYTLKKGIVKGTIEANNERDARTIVQEEGLNVLQVRPTLKLPSAEQMFPSFFKVGAGACPPRWKTRSGRLASRAASASTRSNSGSLTTPEQEQASSTPPGAVTLMPSLLYSRARSNATR